MYNISSLTSLRPVYFHVETLMVGRVGVTHRLVRA